MCSPQIELYCYFFAGNSPVILHAAKNLSFQRSPRTRRPQNKKGRDLTRAQIPMATG
jgi:hypothetical protein